MADTVGRGSGVKEERGSVAINGGFLDTSLVVCSYRGRRFELTRGWEALETGTIQLGSVSTE
jgi:hypothetical protein